ncbi:ABC-2 type transport system permease protein [Lentzea waywayandensis]|uniref:ABC-2 type transport system permease protein n=1 Tax=Lentzea waywayandensis TaxID=84724 RepID=A0A1I6D9Q6_9PSEU|nr:ABC transporter permease [Lentzea waywayandensis]SFR02164.1 ABC-2 type transport system permease protein [Lentzea waywayandensis]
MNGTVELIRLALRRDRVLIPAWLSVFVLLAVGSAVATRDMFSSTAAVVAAAESMNGTPALVAVYGRIYDPTSIGALAMLKALATGAMFLAVFSIVLVVRHTRSEEETGRRELVGAGVVGRHAPLAAALVVAAGTNVVLGLVTSLGLIGAGLPVDGSFVFGLAWMSVGLAFAAIAGIAAQIATNTRGAVGLAVAVLGVVFLLRAIGDTAEVAGPRWLSWLSPLGWGQQFRPYAGDRWWVLLITIGFAVAAAAGAHLLVARRDLNAGLLPDRPGPATGTLRGVFGLAWRLQRGSLLGWAIGFVVYGVLVGSVAGSIGDMLSSPQAEEMFKKLGGDNVLTDAVFAAMFGFLGVIASAYGLQVVSRLRHEEEDLRAELLLAGSVTRARWAASHVVVALGGVAVLLVGAGLAAGTVHAAQTGDVSVVGKILAGALVQIPAAWVLVGLAVAAYGVAPRLVVAGWSALVVFLLLGELGPLFGFDQWLMDLSPWAHLPKVPGSAFTATPLLWLLVVAAAALAAGLVSLRRRDIA